MVSWLKPTSHLVVNTVMVFIAFIRAFWRPSCLTLLFLKPSSCYYIIKMKSITQIFYFFTAIMLMDILLANLNIELINFHKSFSVSLNTTNHSSRLAVISFSLVDHVVLQHHIFGCPVLKQGR